MIVVWVIAIVVLVAIELHSTAFFALFAALGSAVALGEALLGLAVIWQLVSFIGVSLVSILLFRKVLLRRFSSEKPKLRSGIYGLVGELGVVVEPVEGHVTPGRIRLRGDRWLAITYDTSPLNPDQKALVIGIEDGKLVITATEGGNQR